MIQNMSDDGLDVEMRAALADLWERSAATAPTLDEMTGRVARRAVARPRPFQTSTAILVVGALVLLAVAIAIIGSRRIFQPPMSNGPIVFASADDMKLRLFDPRSGENVPFDACGDCRVADADWSRDGSTLAFVRWGEDNSLWTWSFGDSEPSLRWSCGASECHITHPGWSPDDDSIIVSTWTENVGHTNFAIIGSDGSVVRTIPPGDFLEIAFPSWMPDGRILFTGFLTEGPGKMEGTGAIATMAADGTDVRTLLSFDTPPPVAASSPDGKTIAYIAMSEATTPELGPLEYQLWLLDVGTPDARPAPRLLWKRVDCCFGSPIGEADWSPDGTRIAIVALPSDPYWLGSQIQVLSIDVSNGSETVLTPAYWGRPAWRPVP
jgi:dipeptidyl aminopeptidase/acylaminoacyl peptidase